MNILLINWHGTKADFFFADEGDCELTILERASGRWHGDYPTPWHALSAVRKGQLTLYRTEKVGMGVSFVDVDVDVSEVELKITED